MTSSAQTEIVPVLVPIVLRAMRIDGAMVDENSLSTFKYVSTNYSEILERGTALPPPNQYQKPTAVGVRLHWQLPRALRHGEAGALLLKHEATDVSIKQSINGLCQWLQTARRIDNTTPELVVFRNLFPDHPLSLGSTIKAVASGEGQLAWQVSSWADARHYQIQISLDQHRQPQALELRDARVAFPLVPNRWLILRLSDQSDQKGWLIESDYQWREHELPQATAACSFVQTDPKDTQDMPKPIRIGRVFQLNPPPDPRVSPSWKEYGQSTPMFLTAVGPGDPTFAMFAPSAENVFTFFDDLTGITHGNQNFSYHAYGWYANPSQDILKTKSLEALKWSLPSVQAPATGEADHPAVSYQTILHGMVHSVPWPPKNDLKTTEIPDLNNPSLFAVGTTSAEALAAYLTHLAELNTNQPATKALINQLITLQTGALDHCNSAGGKEATAHQALQSRFGSTPGGSYWVIRKQSTPELSSDHEQESDTDNQQLLKKLTELNRNQVALDALQRQLASKQWSLNAYLHPKKILEQQRNDVTMPSSQDALQNKINNLSNEIHNLYADISKLQSDIKDLAEQLHEQINIVNQDGLDQHAAQKNYLLQIPAPRFWHPNDPVVLIDGMGSVDQEEEPDPLPCRAVAQCRLPADNATPFPCGDYADLPPAIQHLFAENLLIASTTSVPGSSQGVWAKAWQSWRHPWVPIFLDWQLQWFPSYKGKGDGQDGWLFNPAAWSLVDGEYQYKPVNSPNIPAVLQTTYIGRTVLSRHCVDHLLAQIQNHQTRQPEGSPDAAAAATGPDPLATFLNKKRIVGQRLSGFHDQLVMRQPNLSLPPRGYDSVLIQDQYHTIPYLQTIDQDKPYFFPQMGGFFVITRLDVVDTFGQCISVFRGNGSTFLDPIISEPIRSPSLRPYDTQSPIDYTHISSESPFTPKYFLQQPLGLIQPAQLVLRWVDADDPAKEVGLVAGANPVCGWMIPNHLDQSLAFYDPQGSFLGEVSQAGQPRWTPAPATSAAQGDAEPEGGRIPNQILDKIVTALSHPTSSILDDWLTGIDKSLWMIDPLGGRADPDLSVLIGRPLAILRLKIALRLEGDTYTNQNPQALADDNGITQISFPVELGNGRLPHDGVVGYFDFATDSNACVLQLVRPEQGSPGCKFLHVKPSTDGQAKDGELIVTVLMDPRGSLHAATGIMPVKEITIPHRFVDEPLRQMQLWFRVRSLLSPLSSISIPRLSEQNGTWEWWEQTTTGSWSSQPVTFTSANATLSVPLLAIRDGWLKLSPKRMD